MALLEAPLRVSATATRHLEHFARAHQPIRDGDALEISKATRQLFPMHRPKKLDCGPPPFDALATDTLPQVSCADLLASRVPQLNHSVRLVLGITSAPNKWGRKIRAGIRRTWLSYPSVNRSVIACFVIGRRSVKPRELKLLDVEAAKFGDLAFLPYVRDGDGPFVTISKAHAWFRLASEQLGLITKGDAEHSNSSRAVIGGYKAVAAHSVRHIAKVDDDTYLNLPELQHDLDSLHCWPHT